MLYRTLSMLVIAFSIITFLLGATIGMSELVSRYRDAPMWAIVTRPGIIYILLNGAAAWGAFGLIRRLHWMASAGGGDPLNQLIVEALAAGTGAMALFRSSLFTVRVGNTDIGIGPSAFLQILLSAADRSCDRERAAPRAASVQKIMAGISFSHAKEALPALCFGLMQNVTFEEQQALGSEVSLLTASPMDEAFKPNSLGLLLMNVVGERVLSQAVDMLRAEITAPPRPIVNSLQLLQLVHLVPFSKATQIHDTAEFLAARPVSSVREELTSAIAKIGAMDNTDRQKTLLFISVLKAKYGEEIVRVALQSLPENERKDPAAEPPGK